MLRGLFCIPFYEADNIIFRLSISSFSFAVLFLKIKAILIYMLFLNNPYYKNSVF